MKIIVLDGYAANPNDLSWDSMKELGELTVYPRTAPNEIVERAKDAEIVLTNKCNLTEDIISQLPKLKYIGELATGFNNIDIDAAHKRGIVVTNIPAYSTESVVQMTFAHILNIFNRVGHYSYKNRVYEGTEGGRWAKNPDFCYWDTPLHELAGKTIGIIGLGHIGSRVAKVARCFGMDVFAMTSKDSASLPEGIQKTTLEGLLGVADIITLHCPLAKDNYHMFNAERIAKMKQGAILINTARGALVDEAAVAKALADGHLSGYGADVMEQEPPKLDNPLLAQHNAYITPHIAWATFEARKRLMDISVGNVKAFLKENPVNLV